MNNNDDEISTLGLIDQVFVAGLVQKATGFLSRHQNDRNMRGHAPDPMAQRQVSLSW